MYTCPEFFSMQLYLHNYLAYIIWSLLSLYFVIFFCHATIYFEQPFIPRYLPGTQQETDGTLEIGWLQKGLFTKDSLQKCQEGGGEYR